jgi:hypothetical protein
MATRKPIPRRESRSKINYHGRPVESPAHPPSSTPGNFNFLSAAKNASMSFARFIALAIYFVTFNGAAICAFSPSMLHDAAWAQVQQALEGVRPGNNLLKQILCPRHALQPAGFGFPSV